MRAIKAGESYDNLESMRISLDLEKIVIEDVTTLEVGLSKGQETKEYWVDIYYLAHLENFWGGTVVYQSEKFKNKKEAKKEYNKILKVLKNGNYTLKSDLRGYLGLEFPKMKESEGYHAITIFAKMLRESLENKTYSDKFSNDLLAEVKKLDSSKSKLFEVVIDLPEKYTYDTKKKHINQEEYESIKNLAKKSQEPLIKEIEDLGGKVTHRLWKANQIGANLTAEQLIELSKSQYVKIIRPSTKTNLNDKQEE